MANFYKWFWSENFWLPHNVTWSDFKDEKGTRYPHASDLYMALPVAVVLIIARILFERIIAQPFCSALGIKNKKQRPLEENIILDKVFNSFSKKPSEERINGIAKELEWSPMQVKRWFRRRKNLQMPTLMKKATESCWRFTFYASIFTFGLFILTKKPWFWDTKHCWYGYPLQPMMKDIYYYYVVELAFYISLTISQFVDVKRKDFWPMLIHHMATIVLITFSYIGNKIRIGTLVMVVHDVADPWLEAAKVFNYAKYQRLCDFLFVMFAISFVGTRLFIYPFWVVYSASIESWALLGPYNSWYLFNPLLYLLQILHVYWGATILKAAYSFIVVGKVEKDTRSHDENSSDESCDEKPPYENHENNKKKN